MTLQNMGKQMTENDLFKDHQESILALKVWGQFDQINGALTTNFWTVVYVCGMLKTSEKVCCLH